MVTREEFLDARKIVQSATNKYGSIKSALKSTNLLESEAIRKSMKQIADYFMQTRKQKQGEVYDKNAEKQH